MKYNQFSKDFIEILRKKENEHFQLIFAEFKPKIANNKIKVVILGCEDNDALDFYENLFRKYVHELCAVYRKQQSYQFQDSTFFVKNLYARFVEAETFDIFYTCPFFFSLTIESQKRVLRKSYQTLNAGGSIIYSDIDRENVFLQSSKAIIEEKIIKSYFSRKKVEIRLIQTKEYENIVLQKMNSVSIKNFLVFSLFMCPTWLLWFAYILSWIENMVIKNEIIEIVSTIIIFSTLNWIYGNKRIKLPLILILNAICFFLLVKSFIEGDFSVSTTLVACIFIYPGLLITILFAQFLTWIPFLVKYAYQNRRNLNDIPWD